MAFDPLSGALWETENADDAYSELNRVVPGLNGGWIQFAGPVEPGRRLEVHRDDAVRQRAAAGALSADAGRVRRGGRRSRGCSCCRAPSTRIRSSAGATRSARPAAAFVRGSALGAEYDGTLWIGSARSFDQVGGNGGSLYRLRLTADRLNVDVERRPAARRSRRRQRLPSAEVRRDRERDAADRHRLRHHDEHRARPRRQPVRRLEHRQRDLSDQPSALTRAPRRRARRPAVCQRDEASQSTSARMTASGCSIVDRWPLSGTTTRRASAMRAAIAS